MCNFASIVLTKERAFWELDTDSHSEIIARNSPFTKEVLRVAAGYLVGAWVALQVAIALAAIALRVLSARFRTDTISPQRYG